MGDLHAFFYINKTAHLYLYWSLPNAVEQQILIMLYNRNEKCIFIIWLQN